MTETSENAFKHSLINISPSDKKRILDILCKDVQFFMACGLMDYSLLLGIQKISQTNKEENKSEDDNAEKFSKTEISSSRETYMFRDNKN